MKDVNLDKELKRFGERVSKLSRINLGKSVKGRRIDSTGKLRKSISYKIDKKSNDITFSFEDYGINVDAGVLGKQKRILKNWNKSLFKRGRGYTTKPPPFRAIRKWIDDKPIRPRNLSSGRFISSKGNIKDRMAAAIRISIYKKGMQPKLFFSDAFNNEWKSFPDKAVNAFANDTIKLISDGTNTK